MRAGSSFFVLFFAAVLAVGVASGQTTYTGGAGASVTSTVDCEYNANAPCTASPYPSTINVPGGTATVNLSAPVSAPFSVTINGIHATVDNEPDGTCGGTTGVAFLLKAPAGQFLEIMSFAGGFADAVTGSSITLSSASGTPMVSGDTPAWNGGASLNGGSLGTYAPGSFSTNAGNAPPTFDNYPSPGPGFVSNSTAAWNNGSATFQSVFNGVQANGTWSLYMIGDDYAACPASFSGWSLSFDSTGTSNDSTSTTVSGSTANPLTKGDSVTFTASVANTTSSTTPTGTVTFTSTPYPSGSATTLCSNVTLSGSGTTATATCTTSAFTAENIFEINATYTPGTGFSSSYTISPYYEWVNNPTTSGGTDVFCNAGTITGTTLTNMSPFPSVVTVSGVSNAVQDVTVQVNDYSFANGGADAQLMLMAPNGSSAMVLMSNLNFGSTSTITGTATFEDGAGPVTATLGSGEYAPTSLDAIPGAFSQTLPATPPSGEPQVPANAANGTYTGIGVPPSVGTATLFSTLNGLAANGTWSLFALTGDQSFSIGGWCLQIVPATGAATTTVVSGVPNPADKAASVAITATVSSGSATPTGTVSFKDGLTNATISGCGSVALVAGATDSATATCDVSTLAEGDHTITATYSGVINSFNQSIGTYDQRIDDAISPPSLSGGVLTYCNPGAIQIPDPNSISGGAAYPNPSNITVAGLFGTVNTVSVALNGFYAKRPDLVTSLLVGPGGNLDFFSGAGGDNAVSTISSILFEDTASGQVPAALGIGPYKPTSDPGLGGAFPPIVFTSSPSYTVPGAIRSAATNGSSTFASSFGGTAPNGNWDLYFYFHDTSQADAGNGLSGWCLNITPNVPTFTITETHSPSSFVNGSTGQITLNVSNTSPAAVTSGGSAYPVTITDTLPNGLTLASVSVPANDWSCSGTTSVTCTNADVVAGGDSYGQLVLNLNVPAAAFDGDNSPKVSEGAPVLFGTPTVLSPADHISIFTTPILSVTEGHSGTFTQGQTGGVLTITVSNTGSISTAGPTTVTETLPTGFTAASFSGTDWSCSGTYSIICTSLDSVAGGSSFNEIDITVAVPSSALRSTTTNAAMAGGGGAIASATSATDTFAVVQVPYSMAAGSGTSPQSAAINTAFGTALSVAVTDAGGIAISGVSVTFTAPSSGASATFSNSTNTITVQTNSSGVASAGSFTANLTMGGPYTVTASSGSLTTVNFSLSNTAGAATHFSVSTPSSATSGTSFNFTVTALDAGNNTATGYTGTVHFTSSDGSATLPSNAMLASGSGTFSATLAAAGNQTVTATDFVSSSITGTSGQINVIVLPVFGVSEGSSGTFTQGQTGGTLTITVSNTAGASSVTSGTTTVTETLPTGFTAASLSGAGWSCSGTTAITCTSTQAVNGGAYFNVIGINVAVAATAVNPTTTNAATASGGTAAALAASSTIGLAVVQVPTSMAAGSGTSPQTTAVNTAFATALSVAVKDAANNPVSGVNVTFTAPASGASGTFSNSTNTITVTTNASGVASVAFTANSTAGGFYAVAAAATGLTTVNFSLTNAAGTANHFAVTAPSSATTGISFNFTVTALDQYNNTAAGYTGTVHFTSTDVSATLPSNSTLTAGAGTFSATLATSGNQTVTATDTVTSSINGTSNVIAASQASQSITFNPLSNQVYGTAPFLIGATASSSLPVSFASQTMSVCTVSNVTVTLVSTGKCTLQATQGGNATYSAATPVKQSFQVTQAQPGLAIGAAPVTYGVGASVTVTVVTSLATIPTGTVTLTVDSGTGVTKTLSGGAATFRLGVLAAGIHPLSASYSGDTDYQAISAAQGTALLDDPTLVVSKAATTVALDVTGQTVTATVSVTPPGAGTPTGSVQFQRGTTVLGTVPLSGLTASLPNVAPGAVTAFYSGDADFNGSTASVGYVAGSSLTVASSANPSTLGQSVTFTASVSSVGAPSGSPTGTVQFLDGAKSLAGVTLSNGQATYTTAMLSGGPHTIVAQYSGDSIYPAAQASYSQTVSAVTIVTLTVSPASPVYGQAVVATATVTPTTAPAGFAPPTGQVTFLLGGTAFTAGTPVGTVALTSGTAVLTLTGLVAGGNEITAEYGGDGTWSGSFRTIVVTVGQAATLQAATNTSLDLAVVSGQLTLTANVTPVTPGAGSPTGSVQFVNTANSAVVATTSLSDGTASVTVPSNMAAQPIEAVYSGDANFLASTSAALPAVSSAAALLTTVFAPDELASLYGITGLSGDTTGAQPLPTSLGGATVTITDSSGVSRPAQLSAVFASASQINFAIPPGTAAGLATVAITLPGGATLVTVIQVGSTAPGIFTANMTGQGVFAGQVVYGNPDGSQTIANAAVWNAAANQYVPNPIDLSPADEQVFLVLYGTGIRHAGILTASVNGVSLPVAYFGAQSQFTGLDQVNLQVPHSLAGAGLVNLVVTVDSAPANTVTMSID